MSSEIVEYPLSEAGTRQRMREQTEEWENSENARVVIFEVFMAVTMKNAVFWDVTLYGDCKNRRFGGT
jgi:hypothetical protein